MTSTSPNGQLSVAEGAELDFESKGTHSVTARVKDDGGKRDNITVSISVTDVDEEGMIELSAETPELGSELTAAVMDPDGDVTSISWQWERSEDQMTWTPIEGATSAAYTPETADEGQYLRATVAYTDRNGANKMADMVFADAVPVIVVPTPEPTPVPTPAPTPVPTPGADACTHAGADTGTAHADAGTAHADTGATHANTGTAHADTGTAHADTGTAHADTGTAHADTGTAHARSAGSRRDSCAYGDSRPDPCAYGRRDAHADPRGGRRGRGRVPSVGDHSDSDRSSGERPVVEDSLYGRGCREHPNLPTLSSP